MLQGGIELPRRVGASASPAAPHAHVRIHRTGSINVDVAHGVDDASGLQAPAGLRYDSRSSFVPDSPYVSFASRLPLQSTPESYAHSRQSRQSPLANLGTPFRVQRSPYYADGSASRDERIANMEEALFKERQRAVAAYVSGLRDSGASPTLGNIAAGGAESVFYEREHYLRQERRPAPYQILSEEQQVEDR